LYWVLMLHYRTMGAMTSIIQAIGAVIGRRSYPKLLS
jgi:hypothetical protein